jgi:hypothetical protein
MSFQASDRQWGANTSIVWIALNIPIDVCILIIPAQLLKKVQLREHERRILKMVFSATLLGTLTWWAYSPTHRQYRLTRNGTIGIYGVYETRTDVQIDGFYQETAFIMNDIEILVYAVGASFPGKYPLPLMLTRRKLILQQCFLVILSTNQTQEGRVPADFRPLPADSLTSSSLQDADRPAIPERLM